MSLMASFAQLRFLTLYGRVIPKKWVKKKIRVIANDTTFFMSFLSSFFLWRLKKMKQMGKEGELHRMFLT